MGELAQGAPPPAGSRHASVQAEEGAHQVSEARAAFALARRVGEKSCRHLAPLRRWGGLAEEGPVDPGEQPQVVPRGAAEHDSIHPAERGPGLLQGRDPSIEYDLETPHLSLQAEHPVVPQRGDLAVLAGAQPVQPRLARVDDERRAARLGHRPREVAKTRVAVEVVDPDPGLDRDRYRHRVAHGRDALGDEDGPRHEGGSEAPLPHARAGATHVEVDLVVSRSLGEARTPGEAGGVAPAQLDRHRVLGRIEAKRPLGIPMEKGADRDHLGVEPRPPAEKPQQVPAVAVGAAHHGGDAEPVRARCRARCRLRAHVRDHSEEAGRGEER